MNRERVNNLCAKLGVKLVRPDNSPRYSRRHAEAPETYHRLANKILDEERQRLASEIAPALNKMRDDGILTDENFGRALAVLFDIINDSHSKES